MAASGHILLEDWASKIFSTGTQLQWSDIAAGKYDASVIDPEAEQIKAYGKPIMLSFDHEMDAGSAVSRHRRPTTSPPTSTSTTCSPRRA